MNIVVNVSEELFEYFAKHNCMSDDGWFSHSSELINAFRNGTPLPKGHGRLIDADVLKAGIGNLDGFGVLGRCIDEFPTVIETDKEGD